MSSYFFEAFFGKQGDLSNPVFRIMVQKTEPPIPSLKTLRSAPEILEICYKLTDKFFPFNVQCGVTTAAKLADGFDATKFLPEVVELPEDGDALVAWVRIWSPQQNLIGCQLLLHDGSPLLDMNVDDLIELLAPSMSEVQERIRQIQQARTGV